MYSYKFRIYPNKEQKNYFSKHFGCSRFLYNYFLNIRKNNKLDNGKYYTYYDCQRELTKMRNSNEFSWLKECYVHSEQIVLRHLDYAFQNFFNKSGKYPKFHKKKNKQCCRFPDNVKIKGNLLFLPKLRKNPIKINLHRQIIGKIISTTITKTTTDKYFVSITTDYNQLLLTKNDNKIGLDLGIENLVVCSNGKIIKNPKYLEHLEKQLKYYQKQVSKKQCKSKNRDKTRKKLSKIYEKITNKRKNYIHKFTKNIINDNQIICIEDLNVDEMKTKHKLAKSIISASFGEIIRQLEYKSRFYGRTLVKIDRYFPSSKQCHNCGFINKSLTLSDREWVCPNCLSNVNRDFNASLNILTEGLNVLSGCGMQSDVKQKLSEVSSIEESMT